jgi:hypothetical protein
VTDSLRRPAIRDVYGSHAVPDEDTIRRFLALVTLASGVCKTTSAHRLDDLNQLVTELLPDDSPLELMDVAVSSGTSTQEWSEQLTSAGLTHHIIAGDIDIYASWLSLCWADLLVDPTHERLLCADVFGRGVNTGGEGARSVLASWALKRLVRFSRFLRSEVRHVELVSPELRKNPAITIVADDIFDVRPEMAGRFHALRAANILNRVYFDDDRLHAAIGNLRDRLRPRGLLIVCRTHQDGSNHGTIFRLDTARCSVVARIGQGSEIEDLVA